MMRFSEVDVVIKKILKYWKNIEIIFGSASDGPNKKYLLKIYWRVCTQWVETRWYFFDICFDFDQSNRFIFSGLPETKLPNIEKILICGPPPPQIILNFLYFLWHHQKEVFLSSIRICQQTFKFESKKHSDDDSKRDTHAIYVDTGTLFALI